MDPFLKRVYLVVIALLGLLFAAMVFLGVLRWEGTFWKAPRASLPKVLVPVQTHSIPDFEFTRYQVQPGDTYRTVASKMGLKEGTLRSLNLANDNSEPVSFLLVPSRDAIFHTLRPGQGMGDLARAYGIPLREILRANKKRGDGDLRPGEILVVPGGIYLTQKDPRWSRLESLSVPLGFLKPTTGRFADGFGERVHPLTGKKSFHEGLDLAPGRGARVVASQKGTVLTAGIRAGYGRLVVLDHGGGLTSYYAHLDEIMVKPRQPVARGELIGKVGRTGRATGPHLHFEVRKDGTPQNPFLYLVQ